MNKLTPPPVKQTYKAIELPKRLQDALGVGQDVDVIVEAHVVRTPTTGLNRRLASLIGSGAGGFVSREDADTHLKSLRDEWPD
jgi:hypothetical protein